MLELKLRFLDHNSDRIPLCPYDQHKSHFFLQKFISKKNLLIGEVSKDKRTLAEGLTNYHK